MRNLSHVSTLLFVTFTALSSFAQETSAGQPDPLLFLHERRPFVTNAITSSIQRATASLSVVNGASLTADVAAGAWITIRGVDLANVTRTWAASDFSGNVLPIALGGTSVRVGGKDAAIYYVSSTQINALIPPDVPNGTATVAVTSPSGGSASTTINIAPFSPGLFMFDPENRRYAAATLPDGTLAGKPGLFASNPTLTRPVRAGQQVTLYATGLGNTNPPVPPGLAFSDPRPMNGIDYFHVTVGGQPATVGFVGAISPGLYQINIVVPVLTSGDYPVQIQYAEFQSQTGAMLTIQGDPGFSKLVATPAAISMQAFTTSATPSTQSLQLLSTGEDFNFTLQSSAPWLTFDVQSGRTPAKIQIAANGKALAPGSYNASITVLAPGTASPSVTIPVSVTATNTPQITVSRTNLNYQLVTGSQNIDVPINVLSDAGLVDFTVATSGDSWISGPSSGRTPGVIKIHLSSGSLGAGALTGSVQIKPAGGGTARTVAVSLTVLATAAAGGPPQIVALDSDEMLWGRSGSFGIWGQNIDGATAVTVRPPDGITVDSVKSGSSGRVNLNLAVDPSASEGTHTLTVTTPKGVSNAFAFTVRKGQPQIRDLTPAVVNPGRFYPASFFSSLAPIMFGLAGVDLEGITTFQVDPPNGVIADWAITPSAPTSVLGYMALDDKAAVGTRRLSVVTPAGRSNELTFEVRAASPNAPTIANLSLSSTSISQRPFVNAITYSGKLTFQDVNGDITSGAKIILMADTGGGLSFQYVVVDGGSYLEQKGKTSGTINFEFEQTFSFLYRQLTGTIPVLCMIQDAAGNLSNTLVATVSTWQIAVF